MGGKSGARCYPRHLGKPTGKGVRTCEASGMLRPADGFTEDIRQGSAAKEFADITPGFGTRHPQDVVQLGSLDDPTPIETGGSSHDSENLSVQDMGISDQEIAASVREDRFPRRGY